MLWEISRLKNQDRSQFCCGHAILDNFVKTLAGSQGRQDFSRTFVACHEGSNEVKGYCSLSTGTVDISILPEETKANLPRYPKVPVVYLVRLAVCQSVQRQGLGKILLIDSFKNALQVAEHAGSVAVEVDAIDDKAKAFYSHFGFEKLIDDEKHMYMSMKKIRKLGLSS